MYFCSQVVHSSGKTGHNVEYVLKLAAWSRFALPEIIDDHLFQLEEHILSKVSDKKDCPTLHISLWRYCFWVNPSSIWKCRWKNTGSLLMWYVQRLISHSSPATVRASLQNQRMKKRRQRSVRWTTQTAIAENASSASRFEWCYRDLMIWVMIIDNHTKIRILPDKNINYRPKIL